MKCRVTHSFYMWKSSQRERKNLLLPIWTLNYISLLWRKLQGFRASCKREHYHLRLTESKATLRSQISVAGDLGRWFSSSSADLLNQLPRHSKVHWSHADVPTRLARGRLATLLRAFLLFHVRHVPDYLLNVLSNFCHSDSAHAPLAVLLAVTSRFPRWKRSSLFLPDPVDLHNKDSSAAIPWLLSLC